MTALGLLLLGWEWALILRAMSARVLPVDVAFLVFVQAMLTLSEMAP